MEGEGEDSCDRVRLRDDVGGDGKAVLCGGRGSVLRPVLRSDAFAVRPH